MTFLLETVQNPDRPCHMDRVHDAIGSRSIVGDRLENTCVPESLERPGSGMSLTSLRVVKRVPQVPANALRKPAQYLKAVTDPVQRLALEVHRSLFPLGYNGKAPGGDRSPERSPSDHGALGRGATACAATPLRAGYPPTPMRRLRGQDRGGACANPGTRSTASAAFDTRATPLPRPREGSTCAGNTRTGPAYGRAIDDSRDGRCRAAGRHPAARPAAAPHPRGLRSTEHQSSGNFATRHVRSPGMSRSLPSAGEPMTGSSAIGSSAALDALTATRMPRSLREYLASPY